MEKEGERRWNGAKKMIEENVNERRKGKKKRGTWKRKGKKGGYGKEVKRTEERERQEEERKTIKGREGKGCR